MPDIKIDKNVPMPGPSASRRFPFEEMAVGDSFFVPFDGKKQESVRHSVFAAATWWGRKQKPPKKFATRASKDGIRCWRIK